MRTILRTTIRLILWCTCCSPAFLHATDLDPAPEGAVVVVANPAVPGSVEVARHYMSGRQIPEQQLILIQTTDAETITREQFVTEIHNPLLAALLERELINALPAATDEFGRMAVSLLENPVRYMVLCYGIPLRINEIPPEELDDLELRRNALRPNHAQLVDSFSAGPLARNKASVDAELALLLRRNVPMNGFIPNPLFRQINPQLTGADIIKVTRLDGPSPQAVLRSMENAWRGEREGLKGRAYADEDGRDGSFAAGNQWIAGAAKLFAQLGFDLSHDTEPATIAADHRIDAPVLYAGWYAGNLNAPFNLPNFRFPPGAIAVHLHSFSAVTVRKRARGWVGPFIERGVSASLGNVHEPYLSLTHHFDLFFVALAQGWSFADAAYFALPGLSWQAVAVGDPFFKPFKTGLESQLEAIGPLENIGADQYVIIRYLNLLCQQEQWDQALATAQQAMLQAPGIALALRRAQLLLEQERPEEAAQALALISGVPPTSAMDWGLHAEAADLLLRVNEPRRAIGVYRTLMALQMPEAVRKAFLPRAIQAARAAGDTDQAIAWQTELTPAP